MDEDAVSCVFIGTGNATGLTLTSKVLKSTTDCIQNDYQCLYWNPSFQSTNTLLQCYTPPILANQRRLGNELAMQVYINFNSGTLSCKTSTKCIVLYKFLNTPDIKWIIPQHFYQGTQIQIILQSKITLAQVRGDSNFIQPSTTNLVGIKLGNVNCIVPNGINGLNRTLIFLNAPEETNQNYFACLPGESTEQYIPAQGFMVNFIFGLASINSWLIKSNEDKNNTYPYPYLFKVYPKVEWISMKQLSPLGGNVITIRGKGFSSVNTQVILEDHDNPCRMTAVSQNELVCISNKISDSLILTYQQNRTSYVGSPGLTWRIFAPSDNVNNIPNSGYVKKGIILETETYSNAGNYYTEYIDGYFKAPYTGKYRFFTSSDDDSQIYLTYNDNRTLINDFRGYSLFADFTAYSEQISKWYILNKDQLYYIEIIHSQKAGDGHLIVGTEVMLTSSLTETNNTSFLNSKSFEFVQKVTIQPKVILRDLLEMQTNGSNTSYTLFCKNRDTKALNPYVSINFVNSISASDFVKSIAYALQETSIVVRKIPLNEKCEYLNMISDASYSSNIKFDDFFLLDTEKNRINTFSSTGTIEGYSFLFFIDRTEEYQRKYQIQDQCFFRFSDTSINENNLRISLRQNVTFGLGGYYQLSYNVTENTNMISVKAKIEDLEDILNKIPSLANNFMILSFTNKEELVQYSIRVVNGSKDKFTVKMNAVTGGLNDENVIRIEEFPKYENDCETRFFFPIPSDYLFIKPEVNVPQVRVISNGLEGVCEPEVCGFTIIFDNPEISSYSLNKDTHELYVNLTKNLSEDEEKTLQPFLFGKECTNVVISEQRSSFTCQERALTGGKYFPLVRTKYGTLKIINDIQPIDIPMYVKETLPSVAPFTGGTTLTLIGENFPEETEGLVISIKSANCEAIVSRNSEIKCIISAPKDLMSEEKLNITYKSYFSDSFDIQFQFKPDAIPKVVSCTPSSVSPGEKQNMKLEFDQDISAVTTLERMSVKLLSNFSNKEIKLRPILIQGNYVILRYPGAAPGIYKLDVKLDQETNADNNHMPIEVTHFITSIFPTQGSLEGGTLIKIQGGNFLKTQVNQVIYIGASPCSYVSNTQTEILCITNPSIGDDVNIPVNVSVTQMVQYSSECKDISNTPCMFTYSTSRTAIVKEIQGGGNNQMNRFTAGDSIAIIGLNLIADSLENLPEELNFDWGSVVLNNTPPEDGDITVFNSTLTGYIKKIFKYGQREFKFYNKFGTARTFDQKKIYIILSVKDPIVRYETSSSVYISPYGGILAFNVDDITGFDNSPTKPALTICNSTCELILTSLPSGEATAKCNIFFQSGCDLFANLPITLVNYMERNVDITGLNVALFNDSSLIDKISSIKINNIEVANSDLKNPTISITQFPISVRLEIETVKREEIMSIFILIFGDHEILPDRYSDGNINGSVCIWYNIHTENAVHGNYSLNIFKKNFGYLFAYSIRVKIPLVLTDIWGNLATNFSSNSSYEVNSSFNGIQGAEMKTKNLNTHLSLNHEIRICGVLTASITSMSMNGITFNAPMIIKYSLYKNKRILLSEMEELNHQNTIRKFAGKGITSDELERLFDGNPYTTHDHQLDFIGVGVISDLEENVQFKIFLRKVMLHISDMSKGSDFSQAVIEGSNDMQNYTELYSFSKDTFTFSWKTIQLQEKGYMWRYIRFNTKNPAAFIGDIKFYGRIVYDDTGFNLNEPVACTVSYLNAIESLPIYSNTKIIYTSNLTYHIDRDGINPPYGSSLGENTVTFTIHPANNLPVQPIPFSNSILMKIYNTQIDPSRITYSVSNGNSSIIVTLKMIQNPLINDPQAVINDPLEIYIEKIGYVYHDDDLYYKYLDRWSDPRTWGQEFIPESNNEAVYIKNMNVLLDVSVLQLKILIIENGSLVVEDTRDYVITCGSIIIINNGEMIVGREEEPFKNNFDMTLRLDKEASDVMPVFGGNVIAVMSGKVDIHGSVRNSTWALLAETVRPGGNKIVLNRAVDWKSGEKIVIASSSVDPSQSEERLIISIDDTKTVITLDQSLVYTHYSAIEHGIDMRAEVGLLTRNIRIHGDPQASSSYNDGSHIYITGTSVGRLSYLETFLAGQAYHTGRYPIHFNLIENARTSYVRGCSLHDTFNRAIAMNGVKYLNVEDNVIYKTSGHAIFTETGEEEFNSIKGNLVIWTRKSAILQPSDFAPASFYIRNPLNYFENNIAAGSENSGFFFCLLPGQVGISKICPTEIPIGLFLNNKAHSNVKFGFRLYPEYNPTAKPCDSFQEGDEVVFNGITVYRNRYGLFADKIGKVTFSNVKSADQLIQGIEISDLFHWVQLNSTDYKAKMINSTIIGYSHNPIQDTNTSDIIRGVILPHADPFLISGASFFNISNKNNFSAITLHSDGKTYAFERVYFDESESDVTRIEWGEYSSIFSDLDGSLTDSTYTNTQENKNNVVVAYLTKYYPHLNSPECSISEEMFNHGLVCDGTKVDMRSVTFGKGEPYFIKSLPIKVAKYFPGLPNSTFDKPEEVFSVLPSKNGWAVPFLTGASYMVTFGIIGETNRYNFNYLAVSRSQFWKKSDKNIDLIFNYTARRDAFVVQGSYFRKPLEATNLDYIIRDSGESTDDLLNYGSFLNEAKNKIFTVRINGLNATDEYSDTSVPIINNELGITPIECTDNICDMVSVTSDIKVWSDPSAWPNSTLPVDGQDVIISSTIILDQNTPKLNSLKIFGILLVPNNNTIPIEISTKSIQLIGGSLEIGTYVYPYKGPTVSISFIGSELDSNIQFGNRVFRNNLLLVMSTLGLHGEDRSPYASKLHASVNPKEKKLLVAKKLKWKAGDEIIIGTTSCRNDENEKVKIKGYDPKTGVIELEDMPQILKFHYGDIETPNGDLIDDRADVLMITRNIQIRTQSNSHYGCEILITNNVINSIEKSVGNVNLTNVEIVNCSKSMVAPALKFMNSNSPFPSRLEKISMQGFEYEGIRVSNSGRISINEVIIYNPIRFGIVVSDTSYDIQISNSHVVNVNGMLLRGTTREMCACYYISPEKADIGSHGIDVVNNVCVGSDVLGFAMNGAADVKNNPNSSVYNTAYASKIGLFVTNNDHDKKILSFSNFIAYNNYNWGVYAFPHAESFTLNNLIARNNLFGVGMFIGNEKTNIKSFFTNSLISGQNPKNVQCCLLQEYEINSYEKFGFMLSTATIKGKSLPLTTDDDPLNALKIDAQFGGYLEMTNITVANYGNLGSTCPEDENSNVFVSNPQSYDAFSIHNIINISLVNVNTSKLIRFSPLKSNPNFCDTLNCTSLNSPIVHIGNMTKEGVAFSSNLNIVPQSSNQTFQFKGQYCQQNSIWNGYLCEQTDFGVLNFENIEANAIRRSMSPVNISSIYDNDTFYSVMTRFADHNAESNMYPAESFTPRFSSVVLMKREYNISFSPIVPKTMIFQLTDVDFYTSTLSKKGITIRIKYSEPQSVIVIKNETEVKTMHYLESETIKGDYCGENKWQFYERELEFYITNEPDCILRIDSVNSIQLNLHLNTTIEEFYKVNGPNELVYSIAAVMKISLDQIRITNIFPGSIYVYLQILEDLPQIGNITLPSSTVITNLELFTGQLIKNIQTGVLKFIYKVVGLSYIATKAPLVDTSIINKINNTNISDNSPTNNSDIPSPSSPDDKNSIWNNPGFIAGMLCIYILLIAGIIIGIVCFKRYRAKKEQALLFDNENDRSPQTTSNLNVKRKNILGNNTPVGNKKILELQTMRENK